MPEIKKIFFTDRENFASEMIAAGLSISLATYVAYMLMHGNTLAAEFGPSGEFLGRFEIVGHTLAEPKYLEPVIEAVEQASTRDDDHVKIVGAFNTINSVTVRITCSMGPDSPDHVEAAQYMELAKKFGEIKKLKDPEDV